MSVALNATSAVCSVISFTFFLIGVISYSSQEETVKNIPWVTVDASGLKLWVGLQKAYYETQGQSTMEIIYSAETCTQDFCHVCNREGQNAFALLVIAVIFSFISMVLGFSLVKKASATLNYANLSMSFVSGLFGVIGWSLFMNKCYRKLVRDIQPDFDYGASSILSLIAFLMCFIVVVLQIVAAVMAPKDAAAQTNAPQPVATNEA